MKAHYVTLDTEKASWSVLCSACFRATMYNRLYVYSFSTQLFNFRILDLLKDQQEVLNNPSQVKLINLFYLLNLKKIFSNTSEFVFLYLFAIFEEPVAGVTEKKEKVGFCFCM